MCPGLCGLGGFFRCAVADVRLRHRDRAVADGLSHGLQSLSVRLCVFPSGVEFQANLLVQRTGELGLYRRSVSLCHRIPLAHGIPHRGGGGPSLCVPADPFRPRALPPYSTVRGDRPESRGIHALQPGGKPAAVCRQHDHLPGTGSGERVLLLHSLVLWQERRHRHDTHCRRIAGILCPEEFPGLPAAVRAGQRHLRGVPGCVFPGLLAAGPVVHTIALSHVV